MNDKISLNIPYKSEFVSVVRLTTTFIGNHLNLDIDIIEDIKLAVSEACNNAIQHSHKNEGEIIIHFILKDKLLSIEIIDSGIGFDELTYKNPNLDDPKENGLGIFIMKSLMDEVKINSKPQIGTAIKLIKNID